MKKERLTSLFNWSRRPDSNRQPSDYVSRQRFGRLYNHSPILPKVYFRNHSVEVRCSTIKATPA